MSKYITEKDRELFKRAMKDITPLKKKNNLSVSSTHMPFPTQNQNTPLKEPPTYALTLNSWIQENVSSQDYLSYQKNGFNPQHFQKLRKGRYTIEATLDLHHLTIEEAETEFTRFLITSRQKYYRVIKLIHGKGSRDPNRPAILKNHVNHWLKQCPFVLAFCSAAAKDGGTGAVYIYLSQKYNTQNKKDYEIE